jgi:hypothetical protein
LQHVEGKPVSRNNVTMNCRLIGAARDEVTAAERARSRVNEGHIPCEVKDYSYRSSCNSKVVHGT